MKETGREGKAEKEKVAEEKNVLKVHYIIVWKWPSVAMNDDDDDGGGGDDDDGNDDDEILFQ